MLNILSLGGGVQSSTVLLMSCKGELPKLDAAIFADTQWEPKAVYNHLTWIEGEAQKAGIPIYKVTAGNIRAHALEIQVRGRKVDGVRWASMPLYTLADDKLTMGQIKRQCTREYKIDIIEKFLKREILGIPKGQRIKECLVDQWFGISADETRRMRVSPNLWKRHIYPLCGLPVQFLDRTLTRQDCKEWLKVNYSQIDVPRSACIGCPFKSDAEWRRLKENPEEWADAVEFDRAIRNMRGMRGKVYLHRSCMPLDEADLSTPEERGQLNWLNECVGYCGI